MAQRFTIVSVGEAVFDIYPDKQILGGATQNVAVHAHQLAAVRGGRGVLVSRVGQDDLGQAVIKELSQRGMTTEYIQTDPDRETGKVFVAFEPSGEPRFEISRDAAWDMLQFDPDIESLARGCDAVCFGTLLQRGAQARTTLYRFLETASRAVRLLDINLREKFYDSRILRRSCELATVVKLNVEEMMVVAEQLGLATAGGTPTQAAERHAVTLLKKFKLQLVVLTRGAEGTVFFSPAGRLEGERVAYPLVPNGDPVGAGDGCSAGLLLGLVLRWPLERTLKLANHMGAYVASQCGACPQLPEEVLAFARD